MADRFSITVSPGGSLGVSIQRAQNNGQCVISSKTNVASPLSVGDVILTMNGIPLANVEGGVGAWCNLFKAFSSIPRNLVVQRSPPPCATTAAAAFSGTPYQPQPSGIRNTSAIGAQAQERAIAKKRALKPSNRGNTKSKKPKGSKIIPDWNHDANYMNMLRGGFPRYGRVSPCRTYYISNNDDTTTSIAKAIGMDDWKKLNLIEFNNRFYNKLTGLHRFKLGTIVKINPKWCSPWKLNKLVDNVAEKIQSMATCSKCAKKEQPGDTDEMLLCDGCDLEIHVSCAGLTAVPKGDFLCEGCLEVLDARRKADAGSDVLRDADGVRSLRARLPPLPPLDVGTRALAEKADVRFREEITNRRDRSWSELLSNQRALDRSSMERVVTLTRNVQSQIAIVDEEKKNDDKAKSNILRRHELLGWTINHYGKSHIKIGTEDGSTRTLYRECSYSYDAGSAIEETKCADWDRYYRKFEVCSAEVNGRPEKVILQNAKDKLSSLKRELAQATTEEKERPKFSEEDRRQHRLSFAKLLSEPILDFETKTQYQYRAGFKTMFLGVVKLEDADIRVLNLLKEPAELVLSIPVDAVLSNDVEQYEVGSEYYLYGTDDLFSTERNDCIPMDFSPTSIRYAQRCLIAMLLRDQRNQNLQVTSPAIPSSVALRGTSEERLCDIMKCFDLGELVRDCHYPILNMPSAETPKRLADNGLVLRDYQKTSLKWLLDKESNPTGMGSSGELWSRMRGLNVSGAQTFFYCELTGSLLMNLFDFASDIGQGDAAPFRGDSFPSSAIIGSEMGLGKTVIALSLVVASPPSIHNTVLPRENIVKINHPAYIPPPSVKSSTYLSNGTLVIAPMTLCPQWQTEIQRFAPWLSVLTLHNEEGNSAAEIASKDVVVISTFLLANQRSRSRTMELLQKLRKIHFHRIFLDESHLNNTASRSADNSRDTNNTRLIKSGLVQLSSTHRYCVTGTPVGQSLADLYGQLRFMRVQQFCREDFWKQNIENAYEEHNCYALIVLRSLLSRVVIRHSKEQTVGNDPLLALPPRKVETLHLPFATKTERQIYEYIEKRNTQRFMELRSVSPATVLGKYTHLNGLLVSARQACAHAGVLNLDDLHNLNEKLEREKRWEDERIMFAQNHRREVEKEKKKKDGMSRLDVFNQAVANARSSAKIRMREVVMEIQSCEIEFVECPICLDPTIERDMAVTPCAHKFCAECILSCLDSTSTTREAAGNCPECREKFKRSELTFLGDAIECQKETCCPVETNKKRKETESNVDINGFNLSTTDKHVAASGAVDRRIGFSSFNVDQRRVQRANLHTLTPEFLTAWNEGYNQIGTKTARLLEEIKGMIQRDSTAKAVIFSQYTGTLDVISEEFAGRGIRFSRVDSMMKQHERADNIISFTTNPFTKVLLLSMKAGAAGLNLVAANYCFLMDPALNSAAEEQAIDRLHRIGQTRPVIVKRFIIKDSVEERILENRRALAVDGPTASTLIDGTASMEENEAAYNYDRNIRGRGQHQEEVDPIVMGEQKIQRLQHLEALFGCVATTKAFKA